MYKQSGKESAEKIKSLCEAYEGYEEWLYLFSVFPLQLSVGEDHVNGRSVGLESTLQFWVDFLCYYL